MAVTPGPLVIIVKELSFLNDDAFVGFQCLIIDTARL